MLELFDLRHGTIVNHRYGQEDASGLTLKVQGLADPRAEVTVNGLPTQRRGKVFSCPIKLTAKFNDLRVSARDNYGERQLNIRVVWDKQSYKRYNFFIDDNIFFLDDIAKQQPKSLFEHFYLRCLKDINRQFGTKFTLNIFYRNSRTNFTLKDFPERYRSEFQDHSDWLRLSFHAEAEFPDRPYQHATAAKLAADYDLVKSEIQRFAGSESFIEPIVIHWGMVPPDNFKVLTERGVRVLSGSFINSLTYVGEKPTAETFADVGYFQDTDTGLYLRTQVNLYDFKHNLCWSKDQCVCNLFSQQEIPALLQPFFSPDCQSDTIGLASHEQYSFPYYDNFLPDHNDRLALAARLVSEQGYQPVFFAQGFLGNMAWE